MPKPQNAKIRHNFYCAECGQMVALVFMFRPAGGHFPVCAVCLAVAGDMLENVVNVDRNAKLLKAAAAR